MIVISSLQLLNTKFWSFVVTFIDNLTELTFISDQGNILICLSFCQCLYCPKLVYEPKYSAVYCDKDEPLNHACTLWRKFYLLNSDWSLSATPCKTKKTKSKIILMSVRSKDMNTVRQFFGKFNKKIMLKNASFKTILKKVMNMKMSLPQFITDRFVNGLVLDNGNSFEANGRVP